MGNINCRDKVVDRIGETDIALGQLSLPMKNRIVGGFGIVGRSELETDTTVLTDAALVEYETHSAMAKKLSESESKDLVTLVDAHYDMRNSGRCRHWLNTFHNFIVIGKPKTEPEKNLTTSFVIYAGPVPDSPDNTYWIHTNSGSTYLVNYKHKEEKYE